MAGGEVARCRGCSARSQPTCDRLPRGEEPLGDAALVEDLDRPRVQPARPRAGQLLARPPLERPTPRPRPAPAPPPASNRSGRRPRSPPNAPAIYALLPVVVPFAAGQYGARAGLVTRATCAINLVWQGKGSPSWLALAAPSGVLDRSTWLRHAFGSASLLGTPIAAPGRPTVTRMRRCRNRRSPIRPRTIRAGTRT